ncbi:MAG: hypothetical protein HZC46_06530 [Ignavibacterium album]|uniref:hypothetical protein n=1 Tax=Ignavibacterium album TaxID=591197 RepID=UPI0026F18457|nr:hypothetical protein [Ignavibacterium album]MBI5661783.1 hypothetical protein [Ignavibacterium album]
MVDRSCINNQLVESETQIIQTGNNKYDIKYYSYLGNWQLATTLEFIPTQPPGCANGEPCTDSEFKEPGIKPKSVNYSNVFPQGDPCVNQNLLAGTIPVYTKNEFLENYNVDACFNLQTQKWQFVVDNNNVLKPRIIQEICENNIANKNIILADSLDGVSPNYPCKQVVEDINNFYQYGWWQPDRYLFKKLLLGHEELHVESYNASLHTFYDWFGEEYRNLLALFPCERFETTAQAEAYANTIIRDVTYKWSLIAIKADPIFGFWYHPYTDITKEDLEQALHTRMYGNITSWWIEAISNCNN